MITSKSLNKKRIRESQRAKAKPITHTEIMRKRGTKKSISAPGDLKSYKGGSRIEISVNKDYKSYTYTLPGSNGSGEYKITSGYQTLVVLDGVLFVNKVRKDKVENITLRSNDFITFSKGDVVSFCPNAAAMSGILVESAEIKTKKISDPITNNTGLAAFNNVRNAKRPNSRTDLPVRKRKSKAEREAFGRAYMEARGVPTKGPAVQTNAAGQIKNTNQATVRGEVNPAASVVEGENPMPMIIEEEA